MDYFGDDDKARTILVVDQDLTVWWEPEGLVAFVADKMKKKPDFDSNAFANDCEEISFIGLTVMDEWAYKSADIGVSNFEAFEKDRVTRALKEFTKKWGLYLFSW